MKFKITLKHIALPIFMACLMFTFTGCKNKGPTVWDEQRAIRYDKQGNPIWGDKENPRLYQTEEEFLGHHDEEFIGLQDGDLHRAIVDRSSPQPRFTPGEPGSGLPALCDYQIPSPNSIFKTIHFETDRYDIKSPTDVASLNQIANQLQKDQNLFLYVLGHCDERGPEEYNLSLGARRANAVRQFIIDKGGDAERIHTISYGKERPLITEHSEGAWQKNRRAEFRYFKK